MKGNKKAKTKPNNKTETTNASGETAKKTGDIFEVKKKDINFDGIAEKPNDTVSGFHHKSFSTTNDKTKGKLNTISNVSLHKTGSELFTTIPMFPPTKLVSKSQIRKVVKPIDPTNDIVRELMIINKQINQILTNVQAQRDVLFDRTETLESEIATCRESMSYLNSRLGNSNNPGTPETPSLTASNAAAGNFAFLTVDTTIEHLKNNPIILDQFFTTNKNEGQFVDIFFGLNEEVRNLFLRYSLHQLDRMIKCFKGYQRLLDVIENDLFIDTVLTLISDIFLSNSVYVFQSDPKTGEYSCHFKSKRIILSLKEGNSLISNAINSQLVTFYTDPSSELYFSQSLDPLFNPENKPILLIPISSEAVFLIVHTDPGSFTFNNEDVFIAKLISNLAEPLFISHNRYEEMNREKELRTVLHKFEVELCTKNHFYSLLPFLAESFSTIINADDTRIFIVKQNKMFTTFHLNEDKRLVEVKHDLIGIPYFIMKSKFHLFTDSLSIAEIPSFSEEIDGWASDKPFGAFPIFLNKETVSAVLCVTREKEKFGNWDFEFLTSITALLALVIPCCLLNASLLSAEEASECLCHYPDSITSFPFESFVQKNSLINIVKKIQEGTKSEIISVYIKNENKNDKDNNEDDNNDSNGIRRLITLRNNDELDVDFVTNDFIEYIYKNEKPINESDPKRLQLFEPPEDLDVQSIMCVTNLKSDEKLAIVCMNSKSGTGRFDDDYPNYVSSFASLIIYSMQIQKRDQTIKDQKNNAAVMETAFTECEEALKTDDPLSSIFKSILKLLHMDNFILLRYKPLNQGYECILISEKCKKAIISEENEFIIHIKTIKTSEKIEKDNFKDNSFLNLFPRFSFMIVDPIDTNLYLACTGNSLAANFVPIFEAFHPLVKALYQNFLTSSQPIVVSSAEMNKIDFMYTSLLDSDVVSRLFSVTNLTEPQKIEAVLKMFSNLDLLAIMETNIDELTRFLLIVRDHYHKNVPFHNWDHAIDTIQFVYSSIHRGRMRRFLRPHHTIAILLAALLHDIDHRGYNTLFHNKTKSQIFITYGEESPLEKHHLALAVKLLHETLITKKKVLYKDEIFWSTFTSSILSTDMVKHFDYMDKFQLLTTSFNSSSEKHLLLLAQLIIKCGNVGNCTRPFDVAFHMAKKLQEEYQIQGKREKELNVEVSGMGETTSSDSSANLADLEISFCNAIVLPLLKTLGSTVPELSDFAIQMEDNKRQWDEYRLKCIANY